MQDYLFTIECPTCQRRLVVRNEAAVGAILNCPKCDSFVEIAPPPDWQRPSAQAPSPQQDTPTAAEAAPKKEERAKTQTAAAVAPAAAILATPEPAAPPKIVPPRNDPKTPEQPPAESSPAEPVATATEAAPWYHQAMPWQWPLWVSVPAAAVLVAVTLWSIVFSRYRPATSPVAPDSSAAVVEPVTTVTDTKPATILPTQLDRRWLPDGSRMIVSLRLSELADKPEVARAIQWGGEFWDASFGRAIREFHLDPRRVRRVTWAATDLAKWQSEAVVLLEFEAGQDLGVLMAWGKPTDVTIGGAACRRMDSGWTQPFVVVGDRFLLTGPAEALRELADRADAKFSSAAIESLLSGASSDEDFLLLVDLKAARESNVRLPIALMDVWPDGRDAWRKAWRLPQGLGLSLRRTDRLQSELALVCEAATDADELQDSLEKKLLPAARKTIDGRIASLKQDLMDGRITAEAAGHYQTALQDARDAMAGARCRVQGQTLHVQIDWGAKYSATAIAAADSSPAMRDDWLGAARGADRENHERIGGGLSAYAKSHGRFPSAARGSAMLSPETRLSWITDLLPYFDHSDWHKQLDDKYQWNWIPNRAVAQRPLEQVTNPALGAATTEAGFPVTHYVGVSGFAPQGDGKLRPGVFGSDKPLSASEIPDGASNTLATLGVTGNPGPWAQGGAATVRPLTQRPYVNGPDGFGSGQPGGMLAGMADGSVRFVSKDVDPSILEQLATADGGGRETATVAALEPPSPVKPPVKPPVAPPEPPAKETVASTEQPPADAKPVPETIAADEPMDEENEQPGETTETAPAKVDVQSRLADPIVQIDLPGVPLVEAVRLVSRMSTIPISFDADALAEAGVRLRDPVQVHVADANVRKLLDAIAESRHLACVVEGDRVTITAPNRANAGLQKLAYEVGDLLRSKPNSNLELVEWIVKLVAPESWKRTGGQGSVQLSGTRIVVEQTPSVHRQVQKFCDDLRVARGLSISTPRDKSSLVSRPAVAAAKLRQPITVNFFAKTPLVQVLAALEQQAQATIVVDWGSLAGANLGPDAATSLHVDQQPLSAALAAALQPLGLAYRALDADCFEVTTRKAVDARLELEFHPVADLVRKGLMPDTLMERVKSQLAGATWNDAGGQAALFYDKPSGYLLVLQTQPNQGRLLGLLNQWAEQPTAPGKAATQSPRIPGPPPRRR